jgi:hypothetical protein
MNIEPIWYEYSPYVYAAGGLVSISNYRSYVAIASGVMLLAAAGTILRMRWVYRKNKALEREREERVKRVTQRKRMKQTTLIIEDDL